MRNQQLSDMKTILALALSMTVTFYAVATVRTVSNDPNNPAQYSTVQAALNASNHGDTVYVNGTQFTYPDFQINRRIVLIGAGYNVSNQLNLASMVSSINLFKDNGVNDASGTVIMGFRINCRLALAGGSLPVNNIRLSRNMIGTGGCFPTLMMTGALNNWTIYNNIVIGTTIDPNATNVLFQNNIVTVNVSGSDQSSVIIDHNVFHNSNNLSTVRYATITNNIFVRTSGNLMDANVQFNTFNNNLSILNTIGQTAPTNSFAGGPNTGAGNFVGVDPLFESVPDFNNYSPAHNYRLKSTSTARNAATDGTDLGIYGGSYPFPSGGAPGSGFDTGAMPAIPQITTLNILNSSLQPGSQLQVNVEARINN
jgi:hypothetical protein